MLIIGRKILITRLKPNVVHLPLYQNNTPPITLPIALIYINSK